MSANLYLISLVSILTAAALPAAKWQSLTPKGEKECLEASPCRLQEEKLTFEVRLLPVEKGGRRLLQSLEFRNLKSNDVQLFSVDEVNKIDLSEKFELQTVQQFRPGVNATDVVLHAYNSAREGKSFYYFLYDSAQEKFVMSNGTFPKLNYDGRNFVTEIQGAKYSLDKKLQFSRVK